MIEPKGKTRKNRIDDVCGNQNTAGFGVAVDLGTTTVSLCLFSGDGQCLSQKTELNPQRTVSEDIMGRIDFALNDGEQLQKLINGLLHTLICSACEEANISVGDIDRMVIAGNTAMYYLLTGTNPGSISKYPFISDTLFGQWYNILGIKTYLFPCMDSFVGGDITAAILSADIWDTEKTVLLCDIGTNGETVLKKDGRFFATSVAAGPAFEGGGISCGTVASDGAVYRAWEEDGNVYGHTIGNISAKGICGSGLIDAVNAFYQAKWIDKHGNAKKALLPVCATGGTVNVTVEDVRALQLAKAAVCGGINTLLHKGNVSATQVEQFLISGSFGNSLDTDSACGIGLFPQELKSKARFIGNGALNGAIRVLLDLSLTEIAEKIAFQAVCYRLGGDEYFNREFLNSISFPEK